MTYLRPKRIVGLLGAAVIVIPLDAFGGVQPSKGDPAHRFRTVVNEVLVPVTATDAEGHVIGDLTPSEFRLFEDGALQVIDSVLAEETPLSLGIVADVSGSMDENIESVRIALSVLFDDLAYDDRVFVGRFSDDFQPIQNLTADREQLQRALLKLEPFGNTALYDGVIEGLQRLRSTDGRRALILVSDGLDNCSKNTAQQAIELARISGIAIYALGLGERAKRRSIYSVVFPRARRVPSRGLDENLLRELAESTGGRLLALIDTRKGAGAEFGATLRDTFDHVSEELRKMYVLAYRPASSELNGKFRELRVEVMRPNLVVRFREGYFASRPAP